MKTILGKATEAGASDVLVLVGMAPIIRINKGFSADSTIPALGAKSRSNTALELLAAPDASTQRETR